MGFQVRCLLEHLLFIVVPDQSVRSEPQNAAVERRLAQKSAHQLECDLKTGLFCYPVFSVVETESRLLGDNRLSEQEVS